MIKKINDTKVGHFIGTQNGNETKFFHLKNREENEKFMEIDVYIWGSLLFVFFRAELLINATSEEVK